MSSQRFSKSVLAASFALALVACGGSDPGDTDGDGSGETGAMLPLTVGNVWEYRVTAADGTITKKRTTVLDKEVVDGTGPYAALMAFKVVTRKGPDLESETDLDKTESWQSPASDCTSCAADVPRDPERIVRYRELSYGAMTHLLQLEEFWDPPRIHVDGSASNTKSTSKWIEAYTETKLPTGEAAAPPSLEHDLWQVLSPDEAIDVAGVHYEHAVHYSKTSESMAVKEYWFKRGVGKLKERGDNQIEDLVSFTEAKP